MDASYVEKLLPNVKVVSTIKQDNDEAGWLNARSKGIGGSDVGPIMGASPFTSAKQIYFRKTNQFQDAVSPNEAARERMHFGHALEPVVANEYARRRGANIVDIGVTVCKKDKQWALANIDRLELGKDGKPIAVVECKTSSEYMDEHWKDGNIMQTYHYQLQWYLYVLGLSRGSFACLVGGNKFYIYDVYYDKELIENTILPAVEKFWLYNVAKMVEPDATSNDTELMDTIYADVIRGSEIVMAEATDDVVDELQHIKIRIKELEAKEKELKNKLKDELMNTEVGYTNNYTVIWSPQTQLRVDTDKLRSMFPDVYTQCVKRIEFRKMSIKGGKLDD